MKRRRGEIITNRLVAALIWMIVLCVYLIPFYYVIINSLKTEEEAAVLSLSLPSPWRFDNFLVSFRDGQMLRGLTNSLVITCLAVFTVIAASSLAAFYIQRSQTRAANFLYYFFVAGIALPISIVTTFGMLQSLQLLNTLIGAALIYSALRIPFVVFIYAGFFKTIPRELDEAAIIDGCGNLRLFSVIIMPLLKPITVTCIILTAQYVWNRFDVILFFILSLSKYTLPLSIYNFAGMYSTKWNLIFAGSIITVLPILLLYLVGQKHIVSGLTAGALKG